MAHRFFRGGRMIPRCTLVAILMLSSFVMARPPQAVDWSGGSGNWVDATKWSTGVVPNNTPGDTYSVTIDGASSAVQLGSLTQPVSYTVDALSVFNGASIRFLQLD